MGAQSILSSFELGALGALWFSAFKNEAINRSIEKDSLLDAKDLRNSRGDPLGQTNPL